MGFIGTKLKGLAALITAAAVTLTAMPMTAAAENAEYTVCFAQTGTKREHSEKADCYYFPEYKYGDFTAPAELETIAKEAGFLDEFYELGDEWTLWGGAYVNALPTVYYGTDTPQYTGLIGTYSTQENSELTEEDAHNAAAKGEFFGSDSTPVAVIETATKPKTYTFQVYKNFSVSEWEGVDPLFTFDTDIESKAFPIEELASRKLPSTVTIAYHYSYEDGDYIYKEKLGSGEAFWNVLSDIAQNEKDHGSSVDFSQMAIYYDKPSITISNQEAFETGLDYTMFTDGMVTPSENHYIYSHSDDDNVWRVTYYEDEYSDCEMEMVRGDKLASLIVELRDSEDISLYHYDSIYVVNSLSEGSSVFFTESTNGLSGGQVDPSAVEKYTLDTLPVYLARATASLGLKPADAEYDAKFYTPSEWTIWGVMSAWRDDNKTGYLSSSAKPNGKLDTPDDFLFEDMEYAYEPVLQVHSMELKKFNIICAEAEGGMLTYTAADHTAFPTKDGVTQWVYKYDNGNLSIVRQSVVTNSDELWNLVLDSTEWDFDFDEGTATLTPLNPWVMALTEADISTDDAIITVPSGETVIPKEYIAYVPMLFRDKNAVIFKYSNGVEWKIAVSGIDLSKISDNGVDLSVVLNETNLPAAVSGVKNAHYRAEMTVNGGRPFGFEALLTIDLSKAAENVIGEAYANLLDVKNGMTLINYTELTDAASFTLSQADGLAIIVGNDILDGKNLTDVDIKLTAPVSGKAAEAPTFTGKAVLESVEWSPELVDGKFEKDTEYTVKLNFKVADGVERISNYLNVTLNGGSDVLPHIDPFNNTFFVRYTFPKTDSSSDSDSDSDSKDDSKDDNDSKDDSKGDSGSKGSSVSGRGQLAGSGSSSTDSKEPAPSLGGKSASWSEIASDISKMAENSKADIGMNGSAAIPAEVIKAIRDRKIIAAVRIDSAKSWIIDGSKITALTAADLSLRAGTSSEKGARGIAGYRFVTAGNSVGAELSVLFKAEHAGKFANLYIIKNGKAEFVSTAKIAADGSVAFSADEKGEYVVMLSDYSDLLGDADNDGKVLITDALAALRHYVGLEKAANPEMLDFNGDGEFTIADAQAILSYAFGMN